jgi:hypothetical protein
MQFLNLFQFFVVVIFVLLDLDPDSGSTGTDLLESGLPQFYLEYVVAYRYKLTKNIQMFDGYNVLFFTLYFLYISTGTSQLCGFFSYSVDPDPDRCFMAVLEKCTMGQIFSVTKGFKLVFSLQGKRASSGKILKSSRENILLLKT